MHYLNRYQLNFTLIAWPYIQGQAISLLSAVDLDGLVMEKYSIVILLPESELRTKFY
jgi:hypothetical protein